jgi:hypothetical protein
MCSASLQSRSSNEPRSCPCVTAPCALCALCPWHRGWPARHPGSTPANWVPNSGPISATACATNDAPHLGRSCGTMPRGRWPAGHRSPAVGLSRSRSLGLSPRRGCELRVDKGGGASVTVRKPLACLFASSACDSRLSKRNLTCRSAVCLIRGMCTTPFKLLTESSPS